MEKEAQQYIQRYRSYSGLFKIVLNASLSAFNFGYCNACFNSIRFDDVVQIFSLQIYPRALTQGILTGCLSLTGGIGALLSSYLLKNFSRKQCYYIIGISMISVCFVMLIPHIITLFIGRLAQGFILGVASAVNPIFIKQFSPIELSANFCPLHQIMMIVGASYAFLQTYMLSLIFSPAVYWRIVFGFPILTSSLMLYNFYYNYPYQTPKYLMLKNRSQQAKQLLSLIYKQQYIEQVYSSLKDAIQQQKKQNKKQQIELQNFNQLQLQAQLLQKNMKQTELTNNTLAVIIAFNLSVHQQCVGMGVIVAYSGEMAAICFPAMEKIFPVVINLTALVCVLNSVPILKYLGRRNSLLFGGISMAICLFILARDFSYIDEDNIGASPYFAKILVLTMILMIRGLYSITLGPVVLMYLPQIVQPNIIPYCVMVNWLSVFTINLTFPILRKLMGGNPGQIFNIYAIITLTCYLINRYALIETQNKTELQIRQEYDRKWK